jgi:hypothetical protein
MNYIGVPKLTLKILTFDFLLIVNIRSRLTTCKTLSTSGHAWPRVKRFQLPVTWSRQNPVKPFLRRFLTHSSHQSDLPVKYFHKWADTARPFRDTRVKSTSRELREVKGFRKWRKTWWTRFEEFIFFYGDQWDRSPLYYLQLLQVCNSNASTWKPSHHLPTLPLELSLSLDLT